MNLTVEQLAEILAGIARSQQAIIDAIESSEGGWRNTHLLNKLNVAANMRVADARLIDIPSRVLLRSQSRVPMDAATIARDLVASQQVRRLLLRLLRQHLPPRLPQRLRHLPSPMMKS
jgi:hypothetical protein